MHVIELNEHWCKGCRVCVFHCPTRSLRIASRFTMRGIHPPELVEAERCNGCRLCELLCPDFAITVMEAVSVNA
ncbi:MAG: 4Fe-4S dicluster domain-containing protein [Chloroflexia bacterium]|nr:4Fe-4S dicluster domain-containing protein [Chloroflexia bacterium]